MSLVPTGAHIVESSVQSVEAISRQLLPKPTHETRLKIKRAVQQRKLDAKTKRLMKDRMECDRIESVLSQYKPTIPSARSTCSSSTPATVETHSTTRKFPTPVVRILDLLDSGMKSHPSNILLGGKMDISQKEISIRISSLQELPQMDVQGNVVSKVSCSSINAVTISVGIRLHKVNDMVISAAHLHEGVVEFLHRTFSCENDFLICHFTMGPRKVFPLSPGYARRLNKENVVESFTDEIKDWLTLQYDMRDKRQTPTIRRYMKLHFVEPWKWLTVGQISSWISMKTREKNNVLSVLPSPEIV